MVNVPRVNVQLMAIVLATKLAIVGVPLVSWVPAAVTRALVATDEDICQEPVRIRALRNSWNVQKKEKYAAMMPSVRLGTVRVVSEAATAD
jgi:hypothetical protein